MVSSWLVTLLEEINVTSILKTWRWHPETGGQRHIDTPLCAWPPSPMAYPLSTGQELSRRGSPRCKDLGELILNGEGGRAFN